MKPVEHIEDMSFAEVVRGLLAGDFTRLSPQFEPRADGRPSPIVQWFDSGFFKDDPEVLAEAFSCACFNGHVDVVEYFLSKGVTPNGGARTGLNAFHWAANRGQLKVVEILIRSGADLEGKNVYDGTVLGCAVWSAVNEPKAQHNAIVERLLAAGADVRAAEYPSGNTQMDKILEQYGAGR